MKTKIWYELLVESVFDGRILDNYALILNGAVKISPKNGNTKKIVITNTSTDAIYLGANADVDPNNGFPIQTNDTVSFICFPDFYCYLYGNNQEIRVLEIE
jgi:hypothetical protein